MSTRTIIGKKHRSKSPTSRVVARARVGLTPGSTIRVAREVMEWSQSELASRAGLTQSTVSAIERGKISLGVERAKRLAVVLGVHPAVLLFPDWESERPALERAARRAAA